PKDVVGAYHQRLALWDPESTQTSIDSTRSGVGLTNLSLTDPAEAPAVAVRTRAPLKVSVRYAVARPIVNAEIELRYYSADGKTRVATTRTGESRERLALKPPGGSIEFTCDALPLKRGAYSVGAVVRDIE